jgi:hypothetical protein
MQSLQQGSRSVAIYAVEFQQLTCDLEWNNKAFINRFRYGLKDDVMDLLITMPKVETLQEFITQAITYNNWFSKRCQEKRFGWGNANHNMISTSSTSEKNASGLEPMQIDAAQYKPLSQGKNDRRCRKGLCNNCSNSKHWQPK